MRFNMSVRFQIQKAVNGAYIPLQKPDLDYVSIGGYEFVCADKSIPFDWNGSSGNWETSTLSFETGYGLFKDFNLADCYDSRYAELGVKREEISAAFLASATGIKEFFVCFDTPDEDDLGFGNNGDAMKNGYRIFLLSIDFYDFKTGTTYPVAQSVLDAFNEGKDAGV